MHDLTDRLFDFISASPTAFHGVNTAAKLLSEAGYTRLAEASAWDLVKGGRYYTTRNNSSLIAFRLPDKMPTGFMMTAAHCDSPTFKIKENAQYADAHYTKLSTEGYGGMIMSTWMDRPLSIAGRVIVSTGNGFETRLVDFKEPCAMIPNLAIHMNRSANDGQKYNPAVDMVPVYSLTEGQSVNERAAVLAGTAPENVLASDLFLYNTDRGIRWGDYISSPRLDNMQCSFACLEGFLASADSASVPVYALFDNEEVGSLTRQGADSTFLADVLDRITEQYGADAEKKHQLYAASSMLSCDNAHAVHPNHGEVRDVNHSVYMNEGIVLKYNATQRYATDGISAALFRLVCEEAGVPFQRYANRPDLKGGGTLGNISEAHVSVNTADIGLPQLAMHSAFETAGVKDTEYLIKATGIFYSKSIHTHADGSCELV